MFIQLIISSSALTVLIVGWYALQRWTHRHDVGADCDYLDGRWGCGDCAASDACVLHSGAAANTGNHS